MLFRSPSAAGRARSSVCSPRIWRAMPLRVMQFLAIVFTALAHVPAGAHLFGLPDTISLTREDSFIVQGIYSGWALFGFVLVSDITANLVLTVMLQGRGWHFLLASNTFTLVKETPFVFFTPA